MPGEGIDMTMAELPPPSEDGEDDTGRLEDLLTTAIERVRALVETDVERVRRRKPGLTQDELARALVKRGTRRVGAARALLLKSGRYIAPLRSTSRRC